MANEKSEGALPRKDLISAAKELNKEIGFEPPIPAKDSVDIAELRKTLLMALQYLEPSDELTSKTKETLFFLKEEWLEEHGELPKVKEGEAEEQENAKKKKAKIKAKTKVNKKPTRRACIGKAIAEIIENGGGTQKQIAVYADELYQKGGGKSNMQQSNYVTRNSLRVVEGMGIITIDGEFVNAKNQ